ncbi:MAG: hypothetical protein GKS02_06385 [Alphaproteobacteria bacterium]|nr:hypothetical protein [Alphaproteobacteria bacterium]
MPQLTRLLLLSVLAIVLFVPFFLIFDFVLRSESLILRFALAGFAAPAAASSLLSAIIYLSGKEATWGRYRWSANFDIELPWEDAFTLCCDSLNVLVRNHKIEPISKGATEIVARAPWHWRHGGPQEVRFKFWSLGNSVVRIELLLGASVGENLIDGGKFKREVEAILAFLKADVGPAKMVRSTPVYSED